MAPLIPVAGVAVAKGSVGDSAHETTTATPIDPLRHVLLRAAAVTGIAFVLSLLLDVVLASTWGTGLWISPALALTLTTFALGTHLTKWMAAAASAGGCATLLAVFLARTRPGSHADIRVRRSAQLRCHRINSDVVPGPLS